MKATGHAISWIYGEFRIARFVRGKLVEQFAPDYLVETPTDFVRALREAKKHISLKGKGNVSVVHEHDQHVHSFLNVPTMRKRDLEKYLQRRVDQEKTTEGEFAWCYHEAKHKDGGDGILLHMLPKRIVDTTMVTCSAMGLLPTRYVPLTEIVSAYLPTLTYAKSDVILLVAVFSERTEIIVGTGDGEVFFVRELGFGSQHKLQERLGLEISRTARYTKQQTGKIIHEVRIIGPRPEDLLESLHDSVSIQVHLDEQSNDVNFWIHQSAHLPARVSANFITALAQRNITKDSIKRAGVWATLIMMISASVVTTTAANKDNERTNVLVSLNNKNDNLKNELDVLQRTMELSQQKMNNLRTLRSNSMNMPSIFLLHLSKLAADSIVLEEVDVSIQDTDWSVSIRGVARGSIEEIPNILEKFELELESAPWNMTIAKSWKGSWLDQFRSGSLFGGAPASFKIIGLLQ